jgi:hypothetical protein
MEAREEEEATPSLLLLLILMDSLGLLRSNAPAVVLRLTVRGVLEEVPAPGLLLFDFFDSPWTSVSKLQKSGDAVAAKTPPLGALLGDPRLPS